MTAQAGEVTAARAGLFINVATARHLAEQAVQVTRPLGDDKALHLALPKPDPA